MTLEVLSLLESSGRARPGTVAFDVHALSYGCVLPDLLEPREPAHADATPDMLSSGAERLNLADVHEVALRSGTAQPVLFAPSHANFDCASCLFHRWLRVPRHIEDMVPAFEGASTLGVHYRGTDKNSDTTQSNSLSAHEFVRLIADCLAADAARATAGAAPCAADGAAADGAAAAAAPSDGVAAAAATYDTIYAASDEEGFVELVRPAMARHSPWPATRAPLGPLPGPSYHAWQVRSAFPQMVVVSLHQPRARADSSVGLFRRGASCCRPEQWRLHEQRELAHAAVAEVVALSRCRAVLKTSSALSAFAKVLNPRCDVMCVSAMKVPWFPAAAVRPYVPLASSDAAQASAPSVASLLERTMAGHLEGRLVTPLPHLHEDPRAEEDADSVDGVDEATRRRRAGGGHPGGEAFERIRVAVGVS
jgi:hypothetical protein